MALKCPACGKIEPDENHVHFCREYIIENKATCGTLMKPHIIESPEVTGKDGKHGIRR